MRNIGKSNKLKPAKTPKLVFVDRDGVINRDPIGDYVKTWKDFHFLPRVLKALQLLTKANYSIVIISNQAGIGDGVFPLKSLRLITKNMLIKMRRSGIKVRGVYYCLHGKRAGCKCRKPQIGLFKQAAKKIFVNKQNTYFIGDKASDVLAGKRYGIKNIFVLTGHGKSDRKKLNYALKPNRITKDLYEAVQYLLKQENYK